MAAEEPAIDLVYRYGTNNLIQYNTNLPATTPCANFLASDNGCNILQSGDQQLGWASMSNAEGTIVLTFNFNGAFEVGQSYTLSAGSVFGFTDGSKYELKEGITLYWDGANWTTEKPYIELAYRYGTSTLIQYNTNLPVSTPIADFLADANGFKSGIAAYSAKVCLEQEKAYYVSPAFNGSSTARDEVGLLMQTCFSNYESASDKLAMIKEKFKAAIEECEY
jgi:hypothetical protein